MKIFTEIQSASSYIFTSSIVSLSDLSDLSSYDLQKNIFD